MYLIYFIKSEQDFHRMIALHPNMSFGSYATLTFERFTFGYRLPIAGYVEANTNRLTRSEIAYAKRRLLESPDYYTKVDLPKLLSHIEVLRKFLKANRAYSKFKRNAINTTSTRDDTTSESTLLINALTECSFSWHGTPEGRKYWSDLAGKWQALVRHFKLDKEIIGNYHDKL